MVVTDVHGYASNSSARLHGQDTSKESIKSKHGRFVFSKVDLWSVNWDPNVTSSRLFQKSFENNPRADLAMASSGGKSDSPS